MRYLFGVIFCLHPFRALLNGERCFAGWLCRITARLNAGCSIEHSAWITLRGQAMFIESCFVHSICKRNENEKRLFVDLCLNNHISLFCARIVQLIAVCATYAPCLQMDWRRYEMFFVVGFEIYNFSTNMDLLELVLFVSSFSCLVLNHACEF